MKKTILILITTFISFTQVYSQSGIIRGFVYEKSSGEPVIFTSVYLKGTNFGAATDVNGFFSISQIPNGNYTLMITFVGYDPLREPATITSNQIITKKLYLTESSIKLDEFIVSAERQEMQKAIHASITKVTPKQINQLPSIGSQPDIAQYLQIVPGVVFTGDQGGQLYIRGGSPIQNKVLLDGMVIYNPFHSIGLFSVIDADLIKNADIFTGGFNAQYAGRISSVMDIRTRDGNKKKMKGKLTGDTFGSKLMLEAPLIKESDGNGMSLTAVGSYKSSYLDKTSKTLYSYANENGLPFGFSDLYGKLSLTGKNGSKVNIFGFNFTDFVKNYQELSDLNWSSYGLGSNIVLIPQGSSLITANMAFSNYQIEMDTPDDAPRSSGINGFNMGLNFTYFLGDDQLDYGFEILGFRTNFDYQNSFGLEVSQTENTSEMGAFAIYKKNFGKLIIEPGFRVQYYASLSEPSLEPRFGLKYKATDKLRLKAAAGLYSQNLIAANSDKDVVNLFYGFLSGTKMLQDTFDGSEVTSALQKSKHVIFGFEYDINHRLNLNVEGYYKYNNQLTELNRNKIFNEDVVYAPYLLKENFIIEKGDAYGVDFLLKYDYKQLYIWGVYSLGYSHRTGEFMNTKGEIYTQTYVPHFDRRHNINLMVSYTFGHDLNWEASARWNYGSGFPFTPTKGYYERIPLNNGIESDYITPNGELAYLLGDINSSRLPEYHRLDINIKRAFFIGEWGELQITGSVTNVYDWKNIFYVDRVEMKKVYQLPILPSFGMSFTF